MPWCDRQLYYVKGSNCTPREQIAEWVSANLAQRFGLPTPHCDIAVIDPELVELTSPEWQRDLKLECCFASRSIDPCQTLPLTVAKRVNESLQRDILLFDYWICNSDRNLSETGGNVNILTNPAGFDIQVIDFNLSFDEAFKVSDLYLHVFWPRSKGSLPDMFDQVDYETRFQTVLTDLESLFKKIPAEWLASETVRVDYTDYLRETLERFQRPKFWDDLL